MKPSDADVVKSLLSARPGPEACPDANLLVGWAESRLEDARRVRVEEHLAVCDTCREEALLLRAELSVKAERPTARATGWALRILRAPLAIAAVALVAVGAGLWASGVFSPRSPDERGTDELLLAAASDLRRAEPALFEDFQAVASTALDGKAPGAQRGGIALVGLPRVFLASRPAFAWQAAPGALAYDVRVLDGAGAPVWSRRTNETTLAYPADAAELAPGAKYVLEVRAAAALGQVETRRGFAVAATHDVERFERAQAAAAARAGSLHPLLVAQLALARGFTLEAERAAEAFVKAHPDDEAGRRTLAHVQRLLGRP